MKSELHSSFHHKLEGCLFLKKKKNHESLTGEIFKVRQFRKQEKDDNALQLRNVES